MKRQRLRALTPPLMSTAAWLLAKSGVAASAQVQTSFVGLGAAHPPSGEFCASHSFLYLQVLWAGRR
ncbi:hypothetical protein [Pyrobaculum sp.]|uniref:hypothetical protein n=1 Tax=Pyrobaculum sp. TaxID=2004705 RepID=UPI003D0FFE7D